MAKRAAAGNDASTSTASEVVAQAEEAIEAGVERAKEEVRQVTERLQERAEP